MSEQLDLSGKLYYTISEVSDLSGVKAHVLRYWESEFPSLRPRKDRGGSRRYRKRDIEEVLAIKKLLYEEGYRIAGARKYLQQLKQGGAEPETQQLTMGFGQLDRQEQMDQIKQDLLEILDILREGREKSAEG